MKKISQYLYTIKDLKFIQIYSRLYKKIFKPKILDTVFKFNMPSRRPEWQHYLLYEEKIDPSFNTKFLNFSYQLSLPKDWNKKDAGKLWLYNLHYFEDLLALNADQKKDFHIYLIDNWIKNNSIDQGCGWEPYPLSLRIVNIIKAWLGGLDLNIQQFKSIYQQSDYLSHNLEKHLLGNHLFVNFKALLFAGIIFKNKEWLKISQKGLLKEIDVQILDDGSHFELSPMYHSLILIDILDIYNLISSFPEPRFKKLNKAITKIIPKMLFFMEAMSHPDGEISFFNDSAFGIAPSKEKISKYALSLGFKLDHAEKKFQIINNKSSGYFCALLNQNKLIFDAAKIGPRYIPAHAHADTLSFELSIKKERVFVNSGTSEYEYGDLRFSQRATKSHNTVVIDRKNSSEVWHSFRVAKKANIIHRSFLNESDQVIHLKAGHNGYKKLIGGSFHHRQISFTKSSLIINDKIEGNYKYAKSYFYFHPNIEIISNDGEIIALGEKFRMKCNLHDYKYSLKNSFWYPQFGLRIKNKVLSVDFDSSEIELIFKWQEV